MHRGVAGEGADMALAGEGEGEGADMALAGEGEGEGADMALAGEGANLPPSGLRAGACTTWEIACGRPAGARRRLAWYAKPPYTQPCGQAAVDGGNTGGTGSSRVLLPAGGKGQGGDFGTFGWRHPLYFAWC